MTANMLHTCDEDRAEACDACDAEMRSAVAAEFDAAYLHRVWERAQLSAMDLYDLSNDAEPF